MATGVDGSVRIDTSINDKGFNAGIAKISTSMKGVMSAISGTISKIGTDLLSTLGTVTVIGTALTIVITKAVESLYRFVDTLYKSLSVTSAYHDQVVQLKNAFDSVKGATMALGTTLLSALAPAIMAVINWLVKAINWVSMFIAALTGQKTVMQYVSGSADGAAKSTGNAANNADKLAKNTDKAAKAAKGALANFDQLNVLQQETNTDQIDQKELNTGNYSGGNIQMIEVQIAPDIQKKADEIKSWIEKIKDWFIRAWGDIQNWALIVWGDILSLKDKIILAFGTAWINIKKGFNDAWGGIKQTWENVKQGFIDGWKDISAKASLAWQDIKADWENVKQGFINGWSEISTKVSQVWQDIKSGFILAWASIEQGALIAWNNIVIFWQGAGPWFKTNVIDPISNWFSTAWTNIKTWASNTWNKIVETWTTASTWFQINVIDPIKNAFSTALDDIKTGWETTFTDISNFVKGVINTIIGFINSMVSAVADGVNVVIRALNAIHISIPATKWSPAYDFGVNIPLIQYTPIPLLAKGAVIPPNAAFAAVLGDQRNGRNLEGPEDLFRQIVREEMAGQQNS